MFDAFFHVLLTMTLDFPYMLKYVEDHRRSSSFLDMIHLVHQSRRIFRSTYTKRYEVLAPHFFDVTVGRPGVNCFVMDCKSDPGEYCEKLLRDLSLLERKIVCYGECLPTTEHLFALRVSLTHLMRQDSVPLRPEVDFGHGQPEKCSSQSCSGELMATLSITAPFLFIQILLDSEDPRETIQLRQIPQEMKLLNATNNFYLRGIIASELGKKLPTDIQSQKLEKMMSEKYSAYVLRNNSWTMIRSSHTPQFCCADERVLPVLVIYSPGKWIEEDES